MHSLIKAFLLYIDQQISSQCCFPNTFPVLLLLLILLQKITEYWSLIGSLFVTFQKVTNTVQNCVAFENNKIEKLIIKIGSMASLKIKALNGAKLACFHYTSDGLGS